MREALPPGAGAGSPRCRRAGRGCRDAISAKSGPGLNAGRPQKRNRWRWRVPASPRPAAAAAAAAAATAATAVRAAGWAPGPGGCGATGCSGVLQGVECCRCPRRALWGAAGTGCSRCPRRALWGAAGLGVLQGSAGCSSRSVPVPTRSISACAGSPFGSVGRHGRGAGFGVQSPGLSGCAVLAPVRQCPAIFLSLLLLPSFGFLVCELPGKFLQLDKANAGAGAAGAWGLCTNWGFVPAHPLGQWWHGCHFAAGRTVLDL